MPQPHPSPRPQPRLLALDPGEARIGVALSDELGLYAHPRPAIRARPQAEALRAIARLVGSESIGEVIVGLPLTLAGERGHQSETVRKFVEALRGAVDIPIREVDERLSSAQAAAQAPVLAGRRDGSLDSAAAAVILQSVLDARRRSFAR